MCCPFQLISSKFSLLFVRLSIGRGRGHALRTLDTISKIIMITFFLLVKGVRYLCPFLVQRRVPPLTIIGDGVMCDICLNSRMGELMRCKINY